MEPSEKSVTSQEDFFNDNPDSGECIRGNQAVPFESRSTVEYTLKFTPDGLCTMGRIVGKDAGEGVEISVPKTQEQRAKRGLKGISGPACRDVRSAARLLQNRHTKDCLSFFTGTLPNLTPEHHQIICEQFSEVVRQFDQMLRRLLQDKGLRPELVGVVEIQMKRYAKYGVYAPHVHIVFPGRFDRRDRWRVSVMELQQLWERALSNITGSIVKCPHGTNVQGVKKDVVHYLAKYISKGSRDRYQDVPESYIPTSWHTITRSLLHEVRDRTINMRDEYAAWLFHLAETFKQMGLITWQTDLCFDDEAVFGKAMQFRDEAAFFRCLEIINDRFINNN